MTDYMSSEGLKIRNKWLILLSLTAVMQVLFVAFGEGSFSSQQFALSLAANVITFLIAFIFVYKKHTTPLLTFWIWITALVILFTIPSFAGNVLVVLVAGSLVQKLLMLLAVLAYLVGFYYLFVCYKLRSEIRAARCREFQSKYPEHYAKLEQTPDEELRAAAKAMRSEFPELKKGIREALRFLQGRQPVLEKN
ncbi:MAG: hypothetical protein KDK48_03490 [Chlamydiia bacterium]|nr:hypothetical protein [Chlamydiia bacterium]